MADTTFISAEDTKELWKYEVSEFTILYASSTYNVPVERITGLDITNDYEKNIVPIMKLNMTIEPSVYNEIVKNKQNIKLKIRMQKYYTEPGSEEKSLKRDYILDTFNLIIDEQDVNVDNFIDKETKKNASSSEEKKDTNELNYQLANNNEFYLYKQDTLSAMRWALNNVLVNCSMVGAISYVAAVVGLKNIVMSPLENNQVYPEVLLPPQSALNTLQYLDTNFGFYKAGTLMYFAEDYGYIINYKGGCTAWRKDEIKDTTILVPNKGGNYGTLSCGLTKHGQENERKFIVVKAENVSISNDSISNNVTEGNNATIINNTTQTTTNTQSGAEGAGVSNTNVITTSSNNPWLADTFAAQKSANAIVIKCGCSDFDINTIAPNKRFTFIFEDTANTEKFKGEYTIASSNINFKKDGNDFTINASMTFKKAGINNNTTTVDTSGTQEQKTALGEGISQEVNPEQQSENAGLTYDEEESDEPTPAYDVVFKDDYEDEAEHDKDPLDTPLPPLDDDDAPIRELPDNTPKTKKSLFITEEDAYLMDNLWYDDSYLDESRAIINADNKRKKNIMDVESGQAIWDTEHPRIPEPDIDVDNSENEINNAKKDLEDQYKAQKKIIEEDSGMNIHTKEEELRKLAAELDYRKYKLEVTEKLKNNPFYPPNPINFADKNWRTKETMRIDKIYDDEVKKINSYDIPDNEKTSKINELNKKKNEHIKLMMDGMEATYKRLNKEQRDNMEELYERQESMKRRGFTKEETLENDDYEEYSLNIDWFDITSPCKYIEDLKSKHKYLDSNMMSGKLGEDYHKYLASIVNKYQKYPNILKNHREQLDAEYLYYSNYIDLYLKKCIGNLVTPPRPEYNNEYVPNHALNLSEPNAVENEKKRVNTLWESIKNEINTSKLDPSIIKNKIDLTNAHKVDYIREFDDLVSSYRKMDKDYREKMKEEEKKYEMEDRKRNGYRKWR